MMQLDITADFERVVESLGGTEKQVQVASRRALKKTLRNLNRVVAKDISGEAKIAQKALKPRAKIAFDDLNATLWLGLNPVAVHNLGNVRITKTGVKVAKQTRKGAFLANMANGERVLIREKSKHYRPELYGGSFGPSGDPRYPVAVAQVEIEDAGNEAAEVAVDALPDLFGKHFEHELNYEVNVK